MKWILLTILLLTKLSSYSQNTYPKKVLIEGRELVLITPDQAKKVNKAFLYMSHYRTLIDSLNFKIEILDSLNYNLGEISLSKTKQINNYKQLLINEQQVSARLLEDLNSTDIKLEKEYKKNELLKPILFGSVGLNVVLLLIILAR